MIESSLNGKSKDILEDNISKLKVLFPEIVSEDKIDFVKLRDILGDNIVDNYERYNFSWAGKSEALNESLKACEGTLVPCKKDSKNWDVTENIYIEGDNLEVLKLLQKSYYNKIKMIYIDPPYNTGKDFIYPDDYKDNIENYLEITNQVKGGGVKSKITSNFEINGRFHTNWLNMLYPRLKLARNLLADNGVIFISIDNNEQANLKKICDELFGENNFVDSLIVKRSVNGMGSKEGYATNHDYILCYKKNVNSKNTFFGLKPSIEYISKFNKEDKFGKYKIDGILRKKGQGARKEDSPGCFYPLYYNPNTHEVFLTFHKGLKRVLPKLPNGNDGRWVWSPSYANERLHRLYASEKGTIYIKDYFSNDNTMKPRSILEKKDYLTDKATNELIKIFGKKIFDTPKPVHLIKDLIENCTENNDFVLDFFSGSATTGEALLKLNSEDNERRKFILIQIPEEINNKSKNIEFKNISEIGRKRIDIVGDKIVDESGNKDLDIGFKVFKLDTSNLTKWNPDFDNFEESLVSNANNIIPDRTELDLVYEIMLKYGLDLTFPVEKKEINNRIVYSVGYGSVLICLGDNITSDLAYDLIKFKEELKSDITRVVFKDNGFKSDSDKTNIKEILRANNIDEFITI